MLQLVFGQISNFSSYLKDGILNVISGAFNHQ